MIPDPFLPDSRALQTTENHFRSHPNYQMRDPLTPLDRTITESVFGLSLRGTANLEGNESAQFLAQVSITCPPCSGLLDVMLLRHWEMFTMKKEIQMAG